MVAKTQDSGFFARLRRCVASMFGFESKAGDCGSQDSGNNVNIPLRCATIQRAGKYYQPVTNYFAKIILGYPGMKLDTVFDINLNEHFVPHQESRKFSNAFKQAYLGSNSRTSNKSNSKDLLTITYMGKQLKGKCYEDQVRIEEVSSRYGLDRNEFSVDHIALRMNFLAIKRDDGYVLARSKARSFFGLGPADMTKKTQTRNILDMLKDDGTIKSKVFSIWLDLVDKKSVPEQVMGQIIFGGVDAFRYLEPIYWHKCHSKNSWDIKLLSAKIGDREVTDYCGKPTRAVLSTGSNDIFAPLPVVQRIYNELRVENSSGGDGLYIVDSRRLGELPDLVLETKRGKFTITPKFYVRPIEGKRNYVAIFPSENNQWLLGTNFLAGFYTVFDLKSYRVGIALKSKDLWI